MQLSKKEHSKLSDSKTCKLVNPRGESDQLVVHFNFAKNGWAKRSLKREAKLRVKN